MRYPSRGSSFTHPSIAAPNVTAQAYLEPALHLKPECLTPPVKVKLLGNTGIAWTKLGQLNRAGDYLKQAMALAQQIGARGAEWWLAGRMALLHHLNGDTERALILAHHAYRTAQPVGDAWVMADLSDVLSRLHLSQGDGKQALHWAEQLQRYAKEKRLWLLGLRSFMRLAAAQMQLGQMAEAYASAKRAIRIYSERSNGQLEEEPELFYFYARRAESLGQIAEADSAHQRADDAFGR